MRAAILFVALAGCATAPVSGDLPGRAAVGEAIRLALACDASEDASCAEQPRRIILHSLRCRPDATREHPGRVFCRFSGTHVRRLHAREFGPECAWLMRDSRGIWQIDIWPDADVCDT
jgi:hypothetical protein